MRGIAVAIAVLLGLIVPAAAQQAEIAAANAKWIAFFNKGDFDGVASLYTADATAFPPGSAMVTCPSEAHDASTPPVVGPRR